MRVDLSDNTIREGAVRRTLRACLITAATVLLVTALPSVGAQAQEGLSVTVTPSTDLVDGQTVTVSGRGFVDLRSVVVLQCAGTIGEQPDVDTAVFGCDFTTDINAVTEAGRFSTTFVVSRTLTLLEDGTVDCGTAAEPCRILVGSGPDTFATAPISFGPPTPQSKADCRHGGWRSLADTQGELFRHQGTCVRDVVARRP
jgi:hypothetical protein